MTAIERVMRVMTHVNVGATMGMVAWIAWSGHQVVSGDWKVAPHRPTTTPALALPVLQGPALPPCCLVPPEQPGAGSLRVERAQPLQVALRDGRAR